MDLSDLWTGALSVRRAGVLLTNLTPAAAVFRTGPDDHSWSEERVALADIQDLFIQAWMKDPRPVPRPGDEARQRAFEDAVFQRATLYLRRKEARVRARQQGE